MPNLTVQFNLRQDIGGIPGPVIGSGNFAIGDTFFTEILMGDIDPNAVGLVSSAVNITFNANNIKNIDNPFNPGDINSPLITAQFPVGRTGILDNNNGSIVNLGGGALPPFIGSPLGINQLETFSLMHFQAVGVGNSNLTLNIDLSQTGFVGGIFADPNTPNQFIQPISVFQIGPIQTVPEPMTVFGIITAAVLGFFLKHKT